MYAKVAFPISNYKTFSYKIPNQLEGKLKLGTRVEVPFGRKLTKGIIVEFEQKTSFKGKVKNIKRKLL